MSLQSMNTELRERFAALNAREQMGVRLAAWAVGLLLVLWVAVLPAWRTLARTPAELDQVDSQLQAMQAQAQEARELRGVPAIAGAQAQEALKSATGRLGGMASLNVNNGRAVLTLKGVSSDALQGWLSEARSAARAQPVEAQLQRAGNGYAGTITMALPGASP
jgi:general secretion pathway protein M